MIEKICHAGKYFLAELVKVILISGVVLYLASIFPFKNPTCILDFSSESDRQVGPGDDDHSPTNISHILFGLMGSVKMWPQRRAYIESWWRPGETRGFVYLDVAPTEDLLPWPSSCPEYRVSENVSHLVKETGPSPARGPYLMAKMVHGIEEVWREGDDRIRWVVMGDDDTIFFVENLVNVLSGFDHNKYYYLGSQSEYVKSNFWFSFNQGFGGGGIILSSALAKALVNDMHNCLRRHELKSADTVTMLCVSDLGVDLTPLKGIHQVDLQGDLSGFLSSHPRAPILSLHHYDVLDPLFPSMTQPESAKHLMKGANYDQSRMVQQTICYDRSKNWSVSVAWGYSVHIYETFHARGYLQMPIETFRPWYKPGNYLPLYMFSTRQPSEDTCEAPHVFYLEPEVDRTVAQKSANGMIVTGYLRSSPRGLPTCMDGGNHSADYVSRVEVYSPSTKRYQMDRSECCDIIHSPGDDNLKVKYRECLTDEVIAV